MIDPSNRSHLARIEPDDRLVVLARTIPPDPREIALKDSADNWARFGEACLGQALYRHRTVYRNASEAPVLSHVELSYFRNLVPVDASSTAWSGRNHGRNRPAARGNSSDHPFVLCTAARLAGLGRPTRTASFAGIYQRAFAISRRVQKRHAGLLRPRGRKACLGEQVWAFRAMETAAILYMTRSEDRLEPDSPVELDADGFDGFGREFEAALRDVRRWHRPCGTFAGLDRMRTVPRWTYRSCTGSGRCGRAGRKVEP